MYGLKKIKKICVSYLRISFAYIATVVFSAHSMDVNILIDSAGVITAPHIENVVDAIKSDYNPYIRDNVPRGQWQNIRGQQWTPVQLGKRFYNSDLDTTLNNFNHMMVGESGHCSVCAITYVNNMGNQKWSVTTRLLDALFVSGAQGGVPNDLCARVKMKRGQMQINSPSTNPNENLITISRAFCFPAVRRGLDSHSERAIVSLLSNVALAPQLPWPVSAVLIHIKNKKRSCLNCYHAIANAPAHRRRGRTRNFFIKGKGLADIYSNGEDPTDIVTNNANFDNNELTAVGNIPVSIGIGHRDGQIFNIDWIDRY